MTCNSSFGKGCSTNSTCPDKWGCFAGMCADIELKRHDTKPAFKVSVEDCDGPMDLTDLVIEVNMWAKGKLKAAIDADDTYFSLADNIGFEQIMVGDTIIMDRVRLPEQMLVTGFDEDNYLVRVQRGYNGTQATSWKKGTGLRIMKEINAVAESEMTYQDILQVDGSTLEDQLVASFLIYEWDARDTCLPGCYYLEFKVLKMESDDEEAPLMLAPEITPSFTPSSLVAADFGCALGTGVEWVRSFPSTGEGFIVKIVNTPE